MEELRDAETRRQGDAESPAGEGDPGFEAERATGLAGEGAIPEGDAVGSDADAETRRRPDAESPEGEAIPGLEADAETRGRGAAEGPAGEVVSDLEAERARGRAGEEASPAGDSVESDADAAIPEGEPVESIATDDLFAGVETPSSVSSEDSQLRALLEAIVYVTEEPLSLAQIATALNQPRERVQKLLDELVAEYDKPEHGVTMREVAGGYKMTTKPEHHETVRNFVRSLKPPLKLSLPALETLAVIAYKQPVTAPEIMEIRGVQGAGVLKTLLDRKLIAAAGRKNVIGKPILYKTTKDFLVQFGLKDLTELPSLKEFEEIRRMAIDGDAPEPAPAPVPPADQS